LLKGREQQNDKILNSQLARNSDDQLDVGKASSRIQRRTLNTVLPTIVGTAPLV
jgi:hypothetical protein